MTSSDETAFVKGTTAYDSARKRITAVLFVTQGFFTASTIAAFTLSPIIAAQLSGSDSAAGFPNTVGLVGRAAFAYPLGYLMDRFGRRRALAGGYSLAVLGAILSMWAVINGEYIAFLLGALLLGMSRSASEQGRYVAAEVHPTTRRARVIGLIVFAGSFGAIVGPKLVPVSTTWMESLELPAAAGPFALAGAAMLLATVTIFLFLRPDPRRLGEQVAREEAAEHPDSVENRVGEERPLREIFATPLVQLAILSMTIGFFVMSLIMVITPLYMNYNDHSTTAISNVIMAHTLGMFGFSWLTGWLIDRFGRIPMIIIGAAVLIASSLLAPLSTEVFPLGVALFLLGLGWNFCFVAGSSLLSDALAAHERGRVQGASEALVALGSGAASLSVGLIFQEGSFLLVSAIGLFFSSALILLTIWLVRKDRHMAALDQVVSI